MQLTVREAAQLLEVPEEIVHKWIRESGLPAVSFGGQCSIHRVELAEWANRNGVALLPAASVKHGQALPSFAEALAAGGVLRDVEGATKRDVLRAVVNGMRLPDGADRSFILEMLMSREDQGSTALGDGIAIPHVRNPIVLRTDRPAITLAFLKEPVEYGALDKKPVSALFTMVNPTIRVHLHLLGRLAFALRSPAFLKLVLAKAEEGDIVRAAKEVDARLGQSED